MLNHKRLTTLFVSMLAATGLATAGLSSAAWAQSDDRTGLTIGIGAGLGHLECAGEYCDGVTEALDLNAHLGALLAPQLAVTGDVWLMAHSQDRLSVSQTMVTGGIQAWVVPRLWLRAGVGVARAAYSYDATVVDIMDTTEWVPAAMAGAGVEVITGNSFVLDVQLRAGSGFFNDGDTEIRNLSLGLGANWY
ncbi:MAG: hypothetical protein Tsb0020_32320 [Haliangiales bacterium]